MIVTRTLLADTPPVLADICHAMGFLRADIWRRFGALGAVGKTASDIRKAITKGGYYKDLLVDGTIRAETTKDVVNDILAYKEAAMKHVRSSISKRTQDLSERKRLYTLLRKDEWLTDSFAHRKMRQHFKHGKSEVDNQFVVRSDKHQSKVVNGKLVITIKIAPKYGSDIELVTTSSGKNVSLNKSNLRLIVRHGVTEIHYVTNKKEGRKCGKRDIGVDKGYTEAFVDSDGIEHGLSFGAVMTAYSDKTAATNKQRNKLHALEMEHRDAGRTAKADRIKKNNLGCQKIAARKTKTQQQLRTIAYTAAHSIVDKAGVVVSEDLTSPIAKKKPWKDYNRRMSAWAKGVLASALSEVCLQRSASLVLVNAAYTSQMDSTNGLLEGKRVGDKFYRENGDVLQADYNSAVNVLARYTDEEISRYMSYKDVRCILLSRSPAQLSVKGLELGVQTRQPSADKSIIKSE